MSSYKKSIWDAPHQSYSKVHDATLIYDIKIKTTATKQGTKTVTEYANLLQNRWQELDHYRTLDLQCSKCLVVVKNLIERVRVYEFLAALNSEYNLVRIQILGHALNETISLVRAEESHWGIMLDTSPVASLALLSSKPRGLTLEKGPTYKNQSDTRSMTQDE